MTLLLFTCVDVDCVVVAVVGMCVLVDDEVGVSRVIFVVMLMYVVFGVVVSCVDFVVIVVCCYGCSCAYAGVVICGDYDAVTVTVHICLCDGIDVGRNAVVNLLVCHMSCY